MGTFGTDLFVLSGFAASDADAFDLQTEPRPPTGLRLPEGKGEVFDFTRVDGRELIAQAMVLRLVTPQGALSELGHAGYGSRLHELIGRNKTDSLRALCRTFVLEAVAQEPRVEDKAVALEFDPQREQADNFIFVLAVKPVAGGDPVTLNLEVAL